MRTPLPFLLCVSVVPLAPVDLHESGSRRAVSSVPFTRLVLVVALLWLCRVAHVSCSCSLPSPLAAASGSWLEVSRGRLHRVRVSTSIPVPNGDIYLQMAQENIKGLCHGGNDNSFVLSGRSTSGARACHAGTRRATPAEGPLQRAIRVRGGVARTPSGFPRTRTSLLCLLDAWSGAS